MASSSKGCSFLASHGKKYDPTFDWNDDDGLLQDPRTHAPYCHVDTKVCFSLVSLLGKLLLHVSLKVSCWDIVTFEILGHCVIDQVWNVGFGAFLKCVFFFDHGAIWAMLVAFGILTMQVICDVVEWTLVWILGVLELSKLCVWLIWMWENLWACVNFVFMNMVKFCGYVHGYIYGYWQILWVLWKILLSMWEFICAWSCGNFFLDM